MSEILDKMNEARSVLAEIMESGGELTEEHEALLDRYAEDSKQQAEWLGHLYRRANAEKDVIAGQMKLLLTQKRKANQTCEWARRTMSDILMTREQAGQKTNIEGVAHLMKRRTLSIPDDPELWPVEFIREGRVTLDKAALKAKYKDGSEMPEGFEWQDAFAVVMK